LSPWEGAGMKRLRVSYGDLNRRRRELGMSYRVLSELSGVSLPVVQRLLSAKIQAPSFPNVMAIASALGGGIPRTLPDGSCTFDFPVSAEKVRERQAEKKARRLVGLVQGTSALEAQAVSGDVYREMIERTSRELLVGSNQRLWGE
jgi:transcriptional regulator with XRE-family HTH domain